MKLEATWFVVSDAERMKVYTFVPGQDGSKRFVQLEERVHPASALKNSELVSDDSGHFKIMTTKPIGSGSGNTPGSKYQPRYEPHQLEAMHFAKEVAEYLYTNHMRGKFKHLILCAADHFCGLLRPELKPALLKATFIERKGYTKMPIKKLEEIALSLTDAKEPVKSTVQHVDTTPVKNYKKPIKIKAKPIIKLESQAVDNISPAKPVEKSSKKVVSSVPVQAKTVPQSGTVATKPQSNIKAKTIHKSTIKRTTTANTTTKNKVKTAVKTKLKPTVNTKSSAKVKAKKPAKPNAEAKVKAKSTSSTQAKSKNKAKTKVTARSKATSAIKTSGKPKLKLKSISKSKKLKNKK